MTRSAGSGPAVEGGPLTLRAHAKVNLGLAVLARRGDGYHELDTLFARLDLHDSLTVAPAAGIELSLTVADGVEPHDLDAGPGNLAYRAARLYLDAAGGPGGARIALHKRIPVAAGLGGGSSDAAAVLTGLAELYPADLDLAALAAELGSDVPFFLSGLPAARGAGRGERLTPAALPRRPVVLVNPGEAVGVAEAFAALQNFSRRLDPERIREALLGGHEPRYTNALQPGVSLLRPAVRDALALLREAGLQGVLLSGSGPTCFGLARDEAHAQRAAASIGAQRPAWWVRTDWLGEEG